MRTRMAIDLSRVPPSSLAAPLDADARRVERQDIDAIASLMLDAYRGTIDDSGETLADAIAEVTRTFDGSYGTFDGLASEVIARDGSLVSATLVTRFEDRPLIAFSMTRPAWKRRGLARAGLLRVLRRLQAAGEQEVRLVVTVGNDAAERLYASLGFVATP